MRVTHVCLITPQFEQMEEFYRRFCTWSRNSFKWIIWNSTSLAPSSPSTRSEFCRRSPRKACLQPGTGGMMLELQVADVDQEYTRLQGLNLGIDFILPPTTFPWGNRSIYLKDPDGNLLNIYSLVPAQQL